MIYQDIKIGSAKILATEAGWALPGGSVTLSEATAKKVAHRMANIFAIQEARKAALESAQ